MIRRLPRGNGSLRYLFEDYAFDTDRRELHRGADVVSIAPQVFDLLNYLIRNRERVVSKHDLVNAIWNGRIVSETALTTRLNAARNAIGDSGEEQRLIKTLPRKGLRFIGTVREAPSPAGSTALDNRLDPPKPALSLPDKPSIAVLPFQNLSGDPEQEYFADGMVEDIITALSRFKSLFVIARNSSFTYKGKAVSIKTVGRELGVRYVLEGSVRKAGSRLRIAGQLIEAATERHLWADHFDGALEDVFGLQDRVAMSVVGLIAPKLELAEIERSRQKPTGELDSYDFYLRGMALATKRRTLPDAREHFKKAVERDPEYAAAYAMAAWTLLAQQVTGGLPLTAEMRADAIQLAHSGARLAKADAFTLARCGHALTYFEHEYDRGLSMVEQAVALNPNLAIAWYSRGWVALMCGDAERAIESFDRMVRLDPLDSQRISAWLGTSWALFCLERFEEGRASATKAIQVSADANSLGAYIANSVYAGRSAEAREAVGQLLKLQPDFRASHGREALPTRSADVRERIATSFRTAGLPD
jgi:TolB-like protein/Tfp pilus assembly protein PilF